ncbi:class I adenylate-forming enzyme family protein [Variovorax paradoxus]|uniref:class I adenylate-forming enzyme family protein n=1 Tax=Variovorax paradoxus TaxID=34073 RepID=UPI003ECF0FED
MILGEIFKRNAALYGKEPALIFEDRIMSHGELQGRVQRLVRGLEALGCKRQDRVAILSRNCIEYVEIYGAAATGGFIAVGLNYRLSASEQGEILEDATPRVLIYEEMFADRVRELSGKLPLDTLLVCIGANTLGHLAYESLLDDPAAATHLIAQAPDTFLLIYTSGTTGKAKGVMLGNGIELEVAREAALSHAAAQTDRMLIVMPFYHIGGPIEMLTYLVVGAAIVLHRTFDAAEILRSIERHRVTAAHLAPTMIQMLLDVAEKQSCDVSSLHTICYASAPMSVSLSRRARAMFGPIFMQIYAMTESGLGTVLFKHQHVLDGPPHVVKRLASAGQPYLSADIRVVRDDGTDCVVGEVGEIWTRTPLVMQGYWRRPEATAAAFAHGYLKTGDMGYWDDDHFLFIVDRKKDMIVSGGENIYSREVEEALLVHPAVAEAAVIGIPHARWGETVMAFVVLRPGLKASEELLVEHCKTLIASYKKPSKVEFLEAMPRVQSTNKIDKKSLRAPFWATFDRQVS